MPSEEMRSRRSPQPPAVATSVVLIAVLAFIGFVAIVMTGLFFYLKAGAPTAFVAATRTPFPRPALQISPPNDLRQFRHQQKAALSGYAWIDQTKGIARIPIAEAMTVIVGKGDRAYDAPEVAPATGSSDGGHP
jgi:hypothetical protein